MNGVTNLPDDACLRDRVTALMPDWQQDAIGDFEFLPGGYSNQNFRFRHNGDDYVLRRPLAPSEFINRELERAFYLQAAQRNAVPCAQIVTLDLQSGEMISRWLAGPLLADQPPAPAELTAFLQRLHDNLPPCPRDYDPIALSYEYLKTGKADRDIVRRLGRLRWQPPESRPCHNDLNPWNLVVTPDSGWVTLDWEWFGNNDPIFDLVTLHQGLGFDNDNLYQLAAQLTSLGDIKQRVTDCLTAFWLREYAWAHAELTKGNQRAEIESQRDLARERIRTL